MRDASSLHQILIAGTVLACHVTGCNTGATLYIGTHDATALASCNAVPGAPDPVLGLDPFYTKYLDAGGIPVVGSAAIDDRAMANACRIVVHAMPVREDIVAAMVQRKLRVAVIGTNEATTDMPEYRDLHTVWPDTDWDGLRGVGATLLRPVSSVGEENLLCLKPDPFQGEFILLGTFSHGIRTLGIEPVDDTFSTRLNDAFGQAKAAGLWANTFAGTETRNYFADGVQDWFNANAEASPADGNNNAINTRAELKVYDPLLAELVGEYLSEQEWTPSCP